MRKPTLHQFITESRWPANAYVREPGFSHMYVRCSRRILEETGALHAAAEATLHAAWVADDLGRDDLARMWRLDSVALWRGGPPLDSEQTVRVIDALRRFRLIPDDDPSHMRRVVLEFGEAPTGCRVTVNPL